ncbi:MAG: tetratricopeptide repeat protein [Acidobacteria bacterium]|nr:tetratricopeptide repeat protein [Acidobacteriota bacterium]
MLRKINERLVRRAWLKMALPLWATALSLCFTAQSSAQDLERLQRFFQASNSSSASGQAFRAGRDLIGERKWAAAAAKFNDFIRTYPRDKNLDAALYWLAFCLKQQGRLAEANQMLERLDKEYPRSNWRDDARALRIEIAGMLGDSEAVKSAFENLPALPARPARPAPPARPAAAPAPRHEKQQEENPDEALRLIALQSLFQVDPERAMSVAVGFLGQDSKASATIQEAALGLIARHGGEKAWPALVDTARNQSIAESVREQAIYWIAHQNRERAAETLIQLYDGEKSAGLKERLLYWLAHSDSERARTKIVEIARSGDSSELREKAIYWIAHRSGEQSFNPLNELYGAEKDPAIKERILYWFAHSNDPRARAKVDEIARADASPELRERAIYWVAHRSGPEATEILVRLYDEQKEEESKEQILYWLGHRGGKAGLQKLFAVARSDSSQNLRERAVHYIGQSKDPEAIKLLEQILK